MTVKGVDTMNFKNKTAIISGAASGMGLLFSQNFASLEGNVVMCDVNEKVLNEKVNEINQKGMGRAAEPQEIIDLVLFIASDKGQFINGENIMIDGGRNAAGRNC